MIGRISAQDVSASYAALGIVRQTVIAAPTAATNAPPSAHVGAGDVVSLSPAARSAAGANDKTPPAADTRTTIPSEPVGADPTANAGATTSRSQRMAAGLMGALDADKDGVLTKQEFVEGAAALLGGRHRRRHDAAEPSREVTNTDERHDHRHRRLERRLNRAFDRLDADDSGTLKPEELEAALERLRTRSAPEPSRGTPGEAPVSAASSPAPADANGSPAAAPSQPSQPSATSTATWSVTTVTFVSIAVRQYQAVAELS